jgi:hypothetical protein
MNLKEIPKYQQRQDSVSDQLADLILVANKLGMYDAADAIQQMIPNLPKLKYGCYIELWEGIFNTCVLDEGGNHMDCVYAKDGMRKEQCEMWRIVK